MDQLRGLHHDWIEAGLYQRQVDRAVWEEPMPVSTILASSRANLRAASQRPAQLSHARVARSAWG
jgi:hypothetical protein